MKHVDNKYGNSNKNNDEIETKVIFLDFETYDFPIMKICGKITIIYNLL